MFAPDAAAGQIFNDGSERDMVQLNVSKPLRLNTIFMAYSAHAQH